VPVAVQRDRPSVARWPAHHLSVIDGGDLPPPPPYRLAGRSSRPPSYRAGFRISQTTIPGTGMSTGCPSVSPRGYALGPTNPPRIIRAAEPSGLRWGGFAPPLFVTHPDIRTRWRSTVRFRDRFDAPSPASRARSSGKYLGSEATEERETDRGRGKKRGKKPRERERNEATRLFTPNHPTPPFSPITPSSPPPFHPRGHLLTPEALPRGRLPNRHVLEKFPRSPRW
jgi:hypothetical protein